MADRRAKYACPTDVISGPTGWTFGRGRRAANTGKEALFDSHSRTKWGTSYDGDQHPTRFRARLAGRTGFTHFEYCRTRPFEIIRS